MDVIWNDGGNKLIYEYKFSKSLKNIKCILFKKIEMDKVHESKNNLSCDIINAYDEAEMFHDGKCVMFEVKERVAQDDIMKLLSTRIKPNRKKG